MLLSPRRASTCADLLRLLAVWLAVVLLAQGCAAAMARAEGPRHVHRVASAHDLWAHAHHPHHHDEAERHHHAASDGSVVASPGEALSDADAAALALVAAFAMLALQAWQPAEAAGGRVWHPAPGWAAHATRLARLSKPPQHG